MLTLAFSLIESGPFAVGALWPSLTNQCSFWPVRAVERYQGPFNRKLANKILIVSNTVGYHLPDIGLSSLIVRITSMILPRHSLVPKSSQACLERMQRWSG